MGLAWRWCQDSRRWYFSAHQSNDTSWKSGYKSMHLPPEKRNEVLASVFRNAWRFYMLLLYVILFFGEMGSTSTKSYKHISTLALQSELCCPKDDHRNNRPSWSSIHRSRANSKFIMATNTSRPDHARQFSPRPFELDVAMLRLK